MLPERGEGQLIAEVVPSGGSVLELGCGTGRVTRQLVRHGFRVTAVDESAAMLTRVKDAEVVCARIEDLDLNRRFDAVVLASNLVNAASETRRSFLATCARHADTVIVEGLPLAWQPEEGKSELGAVTSQLRIERVDGPMVHGVVDYVTASGRWKHSFDARVFADEGELGAALAEASLRFDRWLGADEHRWFVAVPA